MQCRSSDGHGVQDDGQGHQEIVPSLLTQDTLNPSQYGIRIIAAELEPILDKLAAQVVPHCPLCVAILKLSTSCCCQISDACEQRL